METNTPTPSPQPTQTPTPNGYTPFGDNVVKRDYTTANSTMDANAMVMPIAEPSYSPQQVNLREDPYKMLDGSGGGNGASKSNAPTANPAMNNLTDEDKKMGAEQLAKLIMDGYEQINQFANKAVQFAPKKLKKLQAAGEIDLATPIPFDYNNVISAGEFINDFNNQTKDTFTVSREFKKDVTPVLTRVLAKRGAGLTDEQYLMFMFGKDITVKAFLGFQIRTQMAEVIQIIKDQTEAMRGGTSQPMNAQSSTPPPPPPPPPSNQSPNRERPTPPPPPVGDVNAADYNFQSNEAVMAQTIVSHAVPTTGKARVIAQINREKEWDKAIERGNNGGALSYEEKMRLKKGNRAGGKKGKFGKDTGDYIAEIDETEIAEAIVLKETAVKEKDPLSPLE